MPGWYNRLVPAIEPIIVKVVHTPATPELGFGAILAQALGLTGLTLIASLLLGLLLGALFIWMRTRRPLKRSVSTVCEPTTVPLSVAPKRLDGAA